MKRLSTSVGRKLGAVGLIGLAALLFVPIPLVLNSALAKALLDLVHLPLYAAITLGFYAAARGVLRLGPGPSCAAAAVAALVFAGGSEWLQARLGRDASWVDCMNNLSAATISLTGLRALQARRAGARGNGWGLAFLGATALGIALAAVPPFRAASAVREQRLRLPVLGDFEEDWELWLWRGQGEADGRVATIRPVCDHAASGKRALRIATEATPWAGVHLLAGGSDWSAYSTLGFALFNPGDPFELGIRLDGGDGRRSTGAVAIGHGTNTCAVPLHRLKEPSSAPQGEALGSVARLVFHVGEARVERTFFLDDVRLE